MRAFRLIPEICKFNNIEEFIKEFSINKEDLFVVSESIYNNYLKDLSLDSNFIFPKKYGSGEPSDEVIDKVITEANTISFKRVIAIGGGAILDIGKLLVLKGIKNALDIFDQKIDFIKEKELIMIPTTCGTGSEVTNYSVAEIKSKNTKLGIGIDEIFSDSAILIPELLEALPYKFFAFSSLDALIHATESFVSPKSNSYTDLFATKAIEILLKGYIDIAKNGEDYKNQLSEDFLIASNYAGIAFGNTGVGAVHALSYPLSGIYHVEHGQANYEFFIEVFTTYNKLRPEGKLTKLNELFSTILKVKEDEVYTALKELLNKIWKSKPLKDFGMKQEEVELFTASVLEKQQRLLSNNYAPFSKEDILKIYSNLY